MKTINILLLIIVITSCKKEGCTDPKATNYDSSAKSDNGSCAYLIVQNEEDEVIDDEVGVLTLTTNELSSISFSSVVTGGDITNQGGAAVTNRGVTWSTSPSIKGSDPDIYAGSGIGSFTVTIPDLEANTVYYVRAFAINNYGTTYGNLLSFTTTQSIKNGTGVTDIEGNNYPSVIIGSQEWMAKNLRTNKYSNGSLIQNVIDDTEWENLTEGAFCWMENNQQNKNIYGNLYNWYAVNDSRNICPSGWHVPSDSEWTQLTNFIDSDGFNSYHAGRVLKSKNGWGNFTTNNNISVHGNGTDDYGLKILPGGSREEQLHFFNAEYLKLIHSSLWSSSVNSSNLVWTIGFSSSSRSRYRFNMPKNSGAYVRCIKN